MTVKPDEGTIARRSTVGQTLILCGVLQNEEDCNFVVAPTEEANLAMTSLNWSGLKQRKLRKA